MRRDTACSSDAALSTFDMTRENNGQMELANTFFLSLSASPWVLEADNADENRTHSVVMLACWLTVDLIFSHELILCVVLLQVRPCL